MTDDIRKILSESRRKYDLLFETSRDAVMMVDPKEGFLDANKATLEMFACRNKQEFISRGPADFSPERQPNGRLSTEKAQEMMATALKKGSHFFEWTHKRLDGTEFPATVLLSRMEIGGKPMLQATVRDISKEKKAAEEWQRTFNAVSDPMFIQSRDHVILKANTAFFNFIKLKPEEVIGRKCYEIMHRTNKPWPDCPLEKANHDGKPHTEEVFDKVIGVPLLVSTSPILNDKNELIGAVHIAKDITERKKIEDELRAKISALERFQKVTVDRELKMKELKARIAELETKVKTR